jgi:hypothetical protein
MSFRPKADEAVIRLAVQESPAADDDALSRVVRAAPVQSVSQGFNTRLGFAAV